MVPLNIMKTRNIKIIIAMLTSSGLGIDLAAGAEAQAQPAADVPSNTANEAASLQLKFSDMSVENRNAVLAEIEKQDFPAIMQSWIDARRIEHDPLKQMMIQTAMSGLIRKRTPPPQFFTQIKAFIENGSNSKLERGMAIGVLALAATKESADLLIDEAINQQDKDLKDEAIHAIGALGDRSQDEALIPALEKLWKGSHDQQTLAYTAIAMAGIGKATSVQMLLDAAFAPQDKDNRKGAAFGALDEIRSVNAVPPLADLFNKSASTSVEFEMTGGILVRIGDATATQALITRFEKLDDSDAVKVGSWIHGAQVPTLRKGLEAVIDPAIPFHSEKVREAIRAGLKQ